MENNNKNSSEGCHVCGDIGVEESLMTCFNCREAKEHIYCAKIRLGSVPDMWLCQVCRSSTRVLQIPKHVDDNAKEILHQKTSNGLMLLAQTCHDEGASLVFNDTSSSNKQQPQFLAFPSPKRKRRSLLVSRRHRRN